MKKMMKRVATFMAIMLILFMPLMARAEQWPVLSDYNNLPEGYLVVGTKDSDRSVEGSHAYLLVINERVRQSTSEYTRDVIYDFSNLPGNTSYYTSKRQDFEGRNGRIVQSPGVAMTFHYTDKATGPDDFLEKYRDITDEEYRNKAKENIPDTIRIDTIGKYKAVHCTIVYEQVEGTFQNEHWYIPLPTSIPHYGTAYLKLMVSNDVQIYGDLTVDEIAVIYEQWLDECLSITENWVNELMNVTYTVRTENLSEGPISDDWPHPVEDPAQEGELAEDDPAPDEEMQPIEDPASADELEPGEDTAPGKKQESPKEPALSKENGSTEEDTDNNMNDYVDPDEAAILSTLAILMAILFGNTSGFTPAPAGTGTPAGRGPSSSGDLGRWVKPDADGDLIATDPVNGQQRTFVHNGDGTYTDPVSGATYTPEELSEQMEHRADHTDTIQQDEEQFSSNVTEDTERNKERSNESKELEEELRRKEQQLEHELMVQRVARRLNLDENASEEEVRQELERRMEEDEKFHDTMMKSAEVLDKSIDVLEATVEVADYTMAAGEALGGTPGKVISATYKGIKNIGETVAEKGMSTGSVIEGAIKGGTEAATTLMNSGIGKAGVTVGGTVAGEVAEAINDGEDLGSAVKEGLMKGAGNAAIGAVGDAVGDAVEGDGLMNKAAEAAEKLAETAYGKEIVEPNLEGKFDE